MTRWLLLLVILADLPGVAGAAADLAREIRENSFDRDECYRVRDLVVVKEDIKLYLNDGHLIFSKPVAGRRIAAVFLADVEGGDAEVILLPPDRAERRALASYVDSPNLDEHFNMALMMFTGNDAESLLAQITRNPFNKKTPEIGVLLDEQFTPTLRSLGVSYQARLLIDLMNAKVQPPGLFAAVIKSTKLGNFDVVYDPTMREQVTAGQVVERNNSLFYDSWVSFTARSQRKQPAPTGLSATVRDYRINATINPDLSLNAVTRVTVQPSVDNLAAIAFELTPQMEVSAVTIDGRPAEFLQRESLRAQATHRGNQVFVVAPPEPLRAGRAYEFEFRHSGTVIADAGDRVFYISARGNWYPLHSLQFANYDLTFRYPRDLDLAAPGDVVEDRTDGDWRITRLRTPATIRMAAFNLGNYARARVERGGYVVEVCANRALERSLRPRNDMLPLAPPPQQPRRRPSDAMTQQPMPEVAPNPLERLQFLANDVASALEFMVSKFGPPALPHLTVSPIPGTFGQGFPGLIYLSTLSYLKTLPRNAPHSQANEIFFQDLLDAHETAHQWWGNRVIGASYRDNWLLEALASYSSLLYVEKTKGSRSVDVVLDSYRDALLAKGESGQTVESTGAIVMGSRLESSQQPGAWQAITYSKGPWILHMLRRRMGDERFFSMLNEILKRYDHAEISTDDFQRLAAQFMPPKSEDRQLDTFFDQWVYGTGVPGLKLSYTVKGKAPALRLTGTVTQSEVDDDFISVVPVEIQVARGKTVTEWVSVSNEPATFSVPLAAPPLKVTLDPNHAVLRR